MLLVLIFIVAGIYVVFVLWMTANFYTLTTEELHLSEKRVSLTVIIPFRNEEANLENCLQKLKDQNDAEFSVICVDDHSSDTSCQIFQNTVGDDSRFALHSLQLDKGKKAAIELGVQHCDTEWVITRDADTVANYDNLKSISHAINSMPGKNMIILPVTSKFTGKLWHDIFVFEFHSLMAAGLACAHGGIPIMANGANLAFTKRLFRDLDGYRGNRNTSSGDDIFLLQKAVAQNRKQIGVTSKIETSVDTNLPTSFGSWMNQRIRWGSKFRWNGSLANTLVALLVAGINLFVVGLVGFTLYDRRWWIYLATIWVAKSIVDIIFSELFESELNRRSGFVERLILVIINPFLFVLTILLSVFYRPKWKGRKIEV